MGPSDLAAILSKARMPDPGADPNVLVGLSAPDDAGAYRLGDETALIQTVDFFTPILDDPYDYGAVAAANALSDVYAMGGRPLTALNLLAVPAGHIPPETVARIIEGGNDKIREAGAVVLGGHTIDEAEPKFGYAVTGVAHPDRLLTKGAARPGDVLVLTKPIGSGTLGNAIKLGMASDAAIRRLTEVMAALNSVGMRLWDLGVRCATDVTGFGLLGHAGEVARASGVGIVIETHAVPVLDEARPFAARDIFPGGTRKNLRHVEAFTDFDDSIPETTRFLLADAVTSGGLLIAVPDDALERVLAALAEAATPARAVIGRVARAGEGPAPGRIRVVP